MRMMLSGFYRWAIRAGLVFFNPVKDTERVKETVRKIKTINQEQASLLLTLAEPRWQPHMTILYLCGLRVGELRGLTLNDYSTTRRTLRIGKTVYKQGADMLKETDEPFSPTKSARGERIIPLSPMAVQVLDDWKARIASSKGPNPYLLLFPSSRGNPLNDNTLREAITRAADKARPKWEGREPFPKRMTPHVFRHGWARLMLESGLRLTEVMELGGWSTLDLVRHYAQWEINSDEKHTLIKAIEKYNKIGIFKAVISNFSPCLKSFLITKTKKAVIPISPKTPDEANVDIINNRTTSPPIKKSIFFMKKLSCVKQFIFDCVKLKNLFIKVIKKLEFIFSIANYSFILTSVTVPLNL